ncbi:MAG: glutamine--fructose-6-phosphate aminotransferase [Candidatus Schekmanbacteria bacterium RBG_13_48_7]|uniref:Glutamine--fructose-6-phosphate aminotransferase [isomerizing] n=1 Tax=Candidatus Schekmanbacteria bacterium RBG_13_48_7 TaxID=1817878 RepID=A0A1F7RTJ4_9BACT|nr:MAG: glutamine--fructose-6-phosphate aminotransferase [Candidatus Schekmanbacteria bacterium RBG_13_48_7]
MCGISGIIESENVVEKLYQSIKNIEYRGYDSCGIATIDQAKIHVKKNVGYVEQVNKKERFLDMKGSVGIAHTRWATHGGVTQNNSHPHLSCDRTFAVVHNGIITNYNDLRKLLKKKGHTFVSETDTEIIAHLLEENFNKCADVEKAFVASLKQLEGDYAIAFITTHQPDRIFCARHISALILGIGTNGIYLGSDINAFLEYTRNVIYINDGEYAIFSKDTYLIKNILSGEDVNKEIVKVPWDVEVAKKGGYPHFMLKEIHQSVDSVSKVLKIPDEEIEALSDLIFKNERSFIIGIGTTYYVALAAQYYFHMIAGQYFPAITSDEFLNLVEVDENALVMAVSQSGETYDILKTIKQVKTKGAATAAIVNVMGSSVYREVDKAIVQGSGMEVCVLSTKAALAQIAILIRIAIALAKKKNKISQAEIKNYYNQLIELPQKIQTIINELSGNIHTLATKYSTIKNWFFIGRGISYAVALESALKFKEVTYLHAEGMPAGFLKHGTIAVIDQDIFTVSFMPPPNQVDLSKLMKSNIHEIRARKGFVIGIHCGSKETDIFDEEIILPDGGDISIPFMQLVVGQLFAYFTAVVLKRDPDKPRALAKSVTVA